MKIRDHFIKATALIDSSQFLVSLVTQNTVESRDTEIRFLFTSHVIIKYYVCITIFGIKMFFFFLSFAQGAICLFSHNAILTHVLLLTFMGCKEKI